MTLIGMDSRSDTKLDAAIVDIQKPQIRGSVLAKSDFNLTLSIHDLSFQVSTKDKERTKKYILGGINAVFLPGRMTAVMGASGAGKTSLLNLLAAVAPHVKGQKIGGSIRINGQTIDDHGLKMKNISGYVYQDDVILETMTVKEALQMSANLRLPNSHDKEERVQDLIYMLGLQNCQDTKIGSSLKKGISGGERKRVSIGMELITNPSILFLDEPTSGLDTFTAHHVVSTLLELAREQGRTIIATIHQPSSEIFHLFDDLLLLSKGRIMYFGEIEKSIDYFANNGYPCPTYTNPADYIFMNILNKANDNNLEQSDDISKDKVDGMLETWESSTENKELQLSLSNIAAQDIPSTAVRQKARFLTQMNYLLLRALRNVMRNKMVAQVKLFQSVFVGILISIIYWDIPSKPFQAQIQDRSGALFFIVLNQFMSSSMGVLSSFSQERPIFMREYSQGYYSIITYYLSKLIVELPFQILSPVLLIVISYFSIGLQGNFSKFIILCVDGMLVAICGMGLGILAGASFPNMGVALAVLPVIILPLMLFAGLYVNAGSLPGWISWIKYISPTYYGFNAAAKNEFTGLIIPNCPAPLPSPCSGEVALAQLSFNGGVNIWESFIILISIYIMLASAGFMSLMILSTSKRPRL